jgi:hypothetical protein
MLGQQKIGKKNVNLSWAYLHLKFTKHQSSATFHSPAFHIFDAQN